ncbi:ESX secretion-associated protein EspG [Nocardia otitidiscaviarum]|uniref:ESX secretion-associated protein EspG n=1 Tax=Nocardia otitidiscaviarum TaxID=1823 RepID=UPI00189334B8|nr:ESX secretion-associated protein EspG [Nocardia otitidiscaviarum]MBF6236470.1 ESX secretion-associated protein EspG [Nocardia otitidiscaviarum]
MRTWRFSEAGFSVLWKDRTGDRLPAPFLFTSKAATQQEYRAEQEEARERVRDSADHEVNEIVNVVSAPDLYLTVRGGDESDPAGLIRMRAARKADRGYVITQLPGESIYHRGGYTVAECDPVRLTDAVVAALPAVRPGSGGDVALVAVGDGYEHADSRSLVSAVDDSANASAARFLRRPVVSSGQIQIAQGSSMFGPRGIRRYVVGWRDIQGDGRYVITDSPAAAVAADSGRFVSVLNSRVAQVIRAIKEEREQVG